MRPVFPALFTLTPDYKPVASLAKTWTVDPNDSAVKVELRTAQWSDGEPIKASDVRFSWQRLRSGPTGYRYRFLRDVEVLSTRGLVLRFERPMRRWWSLFSLDDMVLPEHAYSSGWSSKPTVSGGPYVVEEWTEGLRVRLVRNRNYWGKPAIAASIDVMFVPDDEIRLQLLDRGELDSAFSEGEINFGARSTARGLATSGAWGPTWWELDLDTERVGASVAEAVGKALDPVLVAEILEDDGRTMNNIPARFPVDDASTGPWEGRGDIGSISRPSGNLTFQLSYPLFPTAAGVARFVHFRLREVGIRAELVGLDSDAFERTLDSEGQATAVVRLRRGADAPDAGAYMDSGSADAAETVGAGDELVTGLADGPWRQAQRRLADGDSTVPLASVRTWIASRKGISGPQATGTSLGPLWNVEHWASTRMR